MGVWMLVGAMTARGGEGIAVQVVDARGAPRPGVTVQVGSDEPVVTNAFGYVRLSLAPGRHDERSRVRRVRVAYRRTHAVQVMSTTHGTVLDHDLLGVKRLSGW